MPTDMVFQVVLFRLLFKLSLRDLVPMFLIRGSELSHETVRDWETRFAPLLADPVRRRRQQSVNFRGQVGELDSDASSESAFSFSTPGRLAGSQPFRLAPSVCAQ
jgi:hypothetical protein